MPLSGPGEGEGGLGTAGIDLCVSNKDSEGYENVTKKVNSRRFKPYLAYSILLTSSNFGKCFWS